MSWRKVLLLMAVLAGGVSSASAQGKYELTPFFGTRFGGRIDTNSTSVDYLKIKSSEDFGVIGDITFWDTFQGEFMWNRQPTTLSAHNVSTNTFSKLTNTNIDMYQFDISYIFRSYEAKLKPFAVAGLGFTHFSNTQQFVGFTNRLSYNLGGGVKYFFSRHVGTRIEVRYSPTRTTTSQGVVCDQFGNCFNATITNHAKQGQANAGLIFRF